MDDVDKLLLLKRGDVRLVHSRWDGAPDSEALLTVTRMDRKNKKIWMKNKETGVGIFLQLN